MEYKKFKSSLMELVSLMKDVEDISDAFRKMDEDFNFISMGRHHTLILSILEDAMDDKDTWISYFLYERDCKFSKEAIGTFKDGSPLYMRNYRDLYNLIINK